MSLSWSMRGPIVRPQPVLDGVPSTDSHSAGQLDDRTTNEREKPGQIALVPRYVARAAARHI